MIKIEDGIYFDEKKKRDPVDRAVVDELRRYAEERGGTAIEADLGSFRISFLDSPNFIFGWEDETVTYFRCNGIETEQGILEIAPPKSLEKLRNLQRVATGASFQADFSFLGELKMLEDLTIFSMPENEKCLPASWECTSTLRTLSLIYHENSISWLPDSLHSFQKLSKLSISSSTSTKVELPAWLGSFPYLKRVFLNGHFSSIPYSLVQTGLPFTDSPARDNSIILWVVTLDEGDVGMYLSNNRELIEESYSGEQIAEGEAIRECKVIFLGDGGVGKSSLIERLMEDTFQLGKPPTDGMRVIPWTTELMDGRSFRLRFLDFGGQEIMHSMHRCFLSAHTVYVVVCAARDDTEIDGVAARWLEQVKAYAPGCPVILVLNKADENPGISVNETNLRERFPDLKTVLKTSAAVEAGHELHVKKLYAAITEYAPSCVQGLRGNRGMLAVKQALEEMSAQETPYIKAEEYRKLCEENHITKKTLQDSLLEWFRDLGVAYFYKREQVDWQLENLRVLNPVWLTNGIYRLILRAGEKIKNGVLTHDDIREILATPYKGDAEEEVTYSAEETEYVLHVMRMFEISHEIQGGKELIPMLMEKNAKKIDSFTKQAIHLQWEGAYLPNNLIHKLMIQKFEELDLRFMWRTGARFRPADGKCTAIAVMKDDKSLDLYVTGGNEKSQRDYLNGFREKIKGILHSLNLRKTTKEFICCTVNGKEGKVTYETVVSSYERGLPEIPIEGTQGFASPTELLNQIVLNPERLRRPKAEEENTKQSGASTLLVDKIKKWADTILSILKTVLFALVFIIILIIFGSFIIDLLKGKNPGITLKELIELLNKVL